MPSSAYNTTPIIKPAQGNQPWHKGKKRKFLILFALIAFATLMAYITTRNQISLQNPFNRGQEVGSENLVNEETSDLSDRALDNIANITIDEVREASSSTNVNLLNSLALSDTETQAEIYREIGNEDPQNHIISYNEFGLSLPSIEIKQGDLITWVNNSPAPMIVAGDGWNSEIPRETGDRFSYGFLFLGEYKYAINDTVEGIITVIK